MTELASRRKAVLVELKRGWSRRKEGDDMLPEWLVDITPDARLLFVTPWESADEKSAQVQNMAARLRDLQPERVMFCFDGCSVTLAPDDSPLDGRPSEDLRGVETLVVNCYDRGGGFLGVMRRYRSTDGGGIEIVGNDEWFDNAGSGIFGVIPEALL
jgi:hypothetical protein